LKKLGLDLTPVRSRIAFDLAKKNCEALRDSRKYGRSTFPWRNYRQDDKMREFLQVTRCLTLRFWDNHHLPFLSFLILGPRQDYRAVMSFINALSELDPFIQAIQTISPAAGNQVLAEFLICLTSLEVCDNGRAISIFNCVSA
jgi:hypothetical protein